MDLEEILYRYWGHASFRPNQRDIIHAIVQGADVMALLPTGGGKSVCFQVPTLAMKGICIVVSPLISLMKDQIDQLKKRGIKANGIFGLKTQKEIDIILDNCIYGDIKFLYLAPERLKNEMFLERLKKMTVCLLAIDEAHCISQWGHDFRPSYLSIASIRQYCGGAPILALTATATPKVLEDIKNRLELKKHKIFRSNLKRNNLTYLIRKTENKTADLQRVLAREKGCGIIYVNYRRTTQYIADLLKKRGIKADHYHGGLSSDERFEKQEKWLTEETPVIVATSAFGMGIDKANVRFVVHLDLPNCLEAYYQEVGRAGRDGAPSNTYLFYNDNDIIQLEENIEKSFPPKEQIRKIYQSLCNYFHLAIGSGKDECYEIDITHFCEKFKHNKTALLSTIKLMELDGHLSFGESKKMTSKIQIIANRTSLFNLKNDDKTLASFLEILLRSYPGIFENPISINEHTLAKRAGISFERTNPYLNALKNREIINYQPKSKLPIFAFLNHRVDAKNLRISKESYDVRKANKLKNLHAITQFVTEKHRCRTRLIMAYFGEELLGDCEKCDICLNRKKSDPKEVMGRTLANEMIAFLKATPVPPNELLIVFKKYPEDLIWKVMRELLDWEKIKQNKTNNTLILNE